MLFYLFVVDFGADLGSPGRVNEPAFAHFFRPWGPAGPKPPPKSLLNRFWIDLVRFLTDFLWFFCRFWSHFGSNLSYFLMFFHYLFASIFDNFLKDFWGPKPWDTTILLQPASVWMLSAKFRLAEFLTDFWSEKHGQLAENDAKMVPKWMNNLTFFAKGWFGLKAFKH